MWDLKNYHLYNPFAASHDRYTTDVAPAQLQSYLNPILDYPVYFLITRLNDWPRVIAFVIGAVHGLNLWAIFLIARHCIRTIPDLPASLQTGLVFVALIIGGTGAGAWPLIGTTTGDLPVAAPILLGLLALLRGIDAARASRASSLKNLLIAGVLIGLGVGAKLTMGAYAVGMLASLFMLPRSLLLRGIACFAGAGAIGALVTGGYHHIRMAYIFGNPLFPLMNTIFHSPYWEQVPLRDARFLPKNIFDAVLYPFRWATDGSLGFVSELPFRDPRLAVVAALSVALFLIWLLGRATGRRHLTPVSPAVRALAIFAIVSYVVWLSLFAIYRYLIPLELLSGVLIILCLGSLMKYRYIFSTAVTTALACIITTAPLEWGHTPFRDRYVAVSAPPLPADTLILIVGLDPVSYLIPFINPATRWISVQNNFLQPNMDNGLVRRERDLVANHTGPLKVLNAGASAEKLAATLAAYRLTINERGCDQLSSNLGSEVYLLCDAARMN